MGGKVAGAIGPMEIRPDAIGVPQLMPQYFGVHEHRGKRLGRLLWRAAMHWGQTNGAAYQLLRTEVAGPSDRLCESEGLASLGFTYWQTARTRAVAAGLMLREGVVPAQVHQASHGTPVRRKPAAAVGDDEHGHPLDQSMGQVEGGRVRKPTKLWCR